MPQDFWSTFWAAMLANTMALSVAGYLAKLFLTHQQAKAIEEHKTTLQVHARERDVQYTLLHERRANALSEIYGALQAVLTARSQLATTTHFAPQFARASVERARRASFALNDAILKGRLFLPLDLAERLENLDLQLFDAIGVALEALTGLPTEADSATVQGALADALALYVQESASVQGEANRVEAEFRRLLSSPAQPS